MKCRKCGNKASINMRQHHLALCKPDFLDWMLQQTQRTIEKYRMFSPQERILVAVSGGKDSLSLWDVLWRLGYKVDGFYIHLGIEGELPYSAESERCARQFAEERGLTLHVVNILQTYGETVPQIAERTRRSQKKLCSVCGLVKRHVMNEVALKHGYSVLATGHNLDDEAAVLLGNSLDWSLELMRRQMPVLPENNRLPRKVKPFCRFYERETAAYALLRAIPYLDEECPFSVGSKMLRNKELLNRLEEQSPGTKLRFYTRFIEISPTFLEKKSNRNFLPAEECCPVCGQPTTSETICAFCRMIQRPQDAPHIEG